MVTQGTSVICLTSLWPACWQAWFQWAWGPQWTWSKSDCKCKLNPSSHVSLKLKQEDLILCPSQSRSYPDGVLFIKLVWCSANDVQALFRTAEIKLTCFQKTSHLLAMAVSVFNHWGSIIIEQSIQDTEVLFTASAASCRLRESKGSTEGLEQWYSAMYLVIPFTLSHTPFSVAGWTLTVMALLTPAPYGLLVG